MTSDRESPFASLASAPTLALGQLIDALERFKPEQEVEFDFGYMRPTTLDSWRGVYSELALGYEYDGKSRTTVASLLAECQSAIGKTFEGWKGGDFAMRRDTLVWVDNPGDYSSTKIIAVGEQWGIVILVTAREDVGFDGD